MKCTSRFKMIVCLLLLVAALATSTVQADVIALKRNAGLTIGGSMDSRFTTASVVTTTVSDAILYSGANDGRWMNSGRIIKANVGGYMVSKFDLSSVPDLAGARINLAQLRLYHSLGNGSNGLGSAGIVLTHDWTEGTGTVDLGSYPGAAGGASFAHPIGYNTGASRNASNGTTPPLQSWGPTSASFFSMAGDVGPVKDPSSAPSGIGYHVYNVTAHVQAWANGWPNYGWALNHGSWDFHMSEAGATYQPVLFIDYTPGGGSNDTTAPAAVTNLATSDPTTSTMTITWTAPGDDAGTGTAGRYDIRYSTSTIDESNWANATQIISEPAPTATGTSQSYILQNLTAGTTYYLAMKTYDEVWNVSALSNVASGTTLSGEGDTMAPAAIASLAVDHNKSAGTSAYLSWTAPGDDYNTGTAATYDLRYSTSTITEDNWASATRYTYNVPTPAVAGTSQAVTVVYLNKNATYYFAIKTVDEAGNWSPLSNVASDTTWSHSDMVSPSTITSLAVSNPTGNAVTLTWSTSGDDAIFGTSAYYDIRYSTSPITENSWFWTATKVTGEPTPLAYGTSQSMTVTGLNAGTTYYFAMRAVDEEMNWSSMASVSATTLTATDGTAPAAISDLVANHPSSGTVRLTWTTPGDDGSSGTAATYDIRYSSGTITEDNWASARQAGGELAPTAAGTTQTWTVQGLSANTTYSFAIKAIDEANNLSALSNVVSSTTLTRSDLNKPVLTEQDFEYLGTFKLPTSVNGRSTYNGSAGLAVRRVNGNLQILADVGYQSDSGIYECTFPGWGSSQSTWPQATVIHDWGKAIFGGVKSPGAYWTEGLLFDASTSPGRLYFSWGYWYGTDGINRDSLGWAELIEGAPVAHGPWKGNEVTAHSQRIRGGSTIIPDWFANTYLGGRRLGLGFGGYYSGYASCSKGPFLAAAMPPSDSTGELDTINLIYHPDAHWGTRDADYYLTPGAYGPAAVGNVGYWDMADEIFGAGCWIDLPDKHAFVVMPSLGHGHIRYIWAWIGMERTEIHRFIYDPKDLAAVAQGSMQPWQPQFQDSIVPLTPRSSSMGASGDAPATISGMAFDPETRTLFVLVPGSYTMGGQETYPLVHGWRIKETPRKVGDINNDGYVNVGDLQLLVAAWGSQKTPPSGHWNADADINTDDFVNVGDLQLLVPHWGE